MEYYSVIKRNKIGSSVVMWMDLDTVRQNEVKSEKVSYSNIYMESRKIVRCNYLQGRNRDTDIENRLVDTWRKEKVR